MLSKPNHMQTLTSVTMRKQYQQQHRLLRNCSVEMVTRLWKLSNMDCCCCCCCTDGIFCLYSQVWFLLWKLSSIHSGFLISFPAHVCMLFILPSNNNYVCFARLMYIWFVTIACAHCTSTIRSFVRSYMHSVDYGYGWGEKPYPSVRWLVLASA